MNIKAQSHSWSSRFQHSRCGMKAMLCNNRVWVRWPSAKLCRCRYLECLKFAWVCVAVKFNLWQMWRKSAAVKAMEVFMFWQSAIEKPEKGFYCRDVIAFAQSKWHQHQLNYSRNNISTSRHVFIKNLNLRDETERKFPALSSRFYRHNLKRKSVLTLMRLLWSGMKIEAKLRLLSDRRMNILRDMDFRFLHNLRSVHSAHLRPLDPWRRNHLKTARARVNDF